MTKLILAVFLAVCIATVMSSRIYRHNRRDYYDMDDDMDMRRDDMNMKRRIYRHQKRDHMDNDVDDFKRRIYRHQKRVVETPKEEEDMNTERADKPKEEIEKKSTDVVSDPKKKDEVGKMPSLDDCIKNSKSVARKMYLGNGVFQPHILYYLLNDFHGEKQVEYNTFAKAIKIYWYELTREKGDDETKLLKLCLEKRDTNKYPVPPKKKDRK